MAYLENTFLWKLRLWKHSQPSTLVCALTHYFRYIPSTRGGQINTRNGLSQDSWQRAPYSYRRLWISLRLRQHGHLSWTTYWMCFSFVKLLNHCFKIFKQQIFKGITQMITYCLDWSEIPGSVTRTQGKNIMLRDAWIGIKRSII